MVFSLYARKQSTYFVNKVYPAIPISSLRHDLMDRARRMTRVNNEHHPWVDMTDEEMLRSCGLIFEDPETKEVLIKAPPISKDISTGLEVNIL